jgi:hypothetical protein
MNKFPHQKRFKAGSYGKPVSRIITIFLIRQNCIIILSCVSFKKKPNLKKIIMKKILNSIYAISVLFFVSCGSNKNGNDELTSDIKEVSSQQSSGTSDAAAAPTNLSVQSAQTPATTTAITPAGLTPAGTNTAGVKLNPAHGQPGHDCAIAVGQPLTGSKPAQTNPVQISSTPAPATNTVTAAPPPIQATGTKSGLNPAHGQPGHRCEIAVGAPLSSAPAVNTTPANNVAVQSGGLPQKISVPAVTTAPPSPFPAAGTGPGLNPAHGQPGHRCGHHYRSNNSCCFFSFPFSYKTEKAFLCLEHTCIQQKITPYKEAE